MIDLTELPYREIPGYPAEVNGVNVLIRLVDGLGFRYRWATEGLATEDLDFQPCESSMDMKKLLYHVNGLVTWVKECLTGEERREKEFNSLHEIREDTLNTIHDIRNSLQSTTDQELAQLNFTASWFNETFPVWNLINGPISDALTHVGQIASWRRINGNPIPRASVFWGTTPKSE